MPSKYNRLHPQGKFFPWKSWERRVNFGRYAFDLPSPKDFDLAIAFIPCNWKIAHNSKEKKQNYILFGEKLILLKTTKTKRNFHFMG